MSAARTRSTLRIAVLAAAVLLCILAGGTLTACGSATAAARESGPATVTIIDQAGRRVTVPHPIRDAYCTSPMGANLMYSLAPEMLVGWNITPTALEKKYIPEQYRNVSGLGGWYGKNTTGNVEEIVRRAPDVVIDLGALDAAHVSEIERISGLLNLPVVMAGGDLTASGETLRYVGKLLGVEERAEELAGYCDAVLQEAREISAKLSAGDKVRVYYAEGMKGLNTDPEGSMHTEVLELVGGQNVAQVTVESDYGMAPVSLEQVLAWDPEVILVASDPAEESNVYEQITTGAQWATVAAVKNKRVYQIPRGPFDWFDRPPCLARIIGVKWLGNLLYPDLYDYDIRQEVKDFYKVFYHMELSDTQLAELMAHAVRTE